MTRRRRTSVEKSSSKSSASYTTSFSLRSPSLTSSSPCASRSSAS
uniref:Uncharacterized protein n=1 Tax=Rhizophora mucronata TaxID=61149 RepID=A0A2P2KHB0_RHIMU